MSKTYDEMLAFISGGYTPQQLIEFKSSDDASLALEELIARKKRQELSCEEESELKMALAFSRVLMNAKALALAKAAEANSQAQKHV